MIFKTAGHAAEGDAHIAAINLPHAASAQTYARPNISQSVLPHLTERFHASSHSAARMRGAEADTSIGKRLFCAGAPRTKESRSGSAAPAGPVLSRYMDIQDAGTSACIASAGTTAFGILREKHIPVLNGAAAPFRTGKAMAPAERLFFLHHPPLPAVPPPRGSGRSHARYSVISK